jgi:ArsR family transcriptional regulator
MTLTTFDVIAEDIEVCQYVDMPKISPCCPPVLERTLKKSHADDLAALLKALADPARLRLLSFIAAQPGGEACVCHLVEPTGLSQPTVSHHLKLMHGAGLLEREKRGAWVYYRVVHERIEAIRAALAPPSSQRSRKARCA